MLVKGKSLSLPFLDTSQAQNEVYEFEGIPLFFKYVIYIYIFQISPPCLKLQTIIMIIIIKPTC